jgi:uncharacterized protein (TIRG00374 family)
MNLEPTKTNTARSRAFQAIWTALKIIIGLGLLVLALREIRLDSLWEGIRSANLTWLGLAVLSILFGLALKLWRWQILIKNYHIQFSFSRLFSAYFVGQATNILLPFRAGELVRIGYFVEEKAVIPEAISTVIIEKYLDLTALAVATLIVSYSVSLENILNLQVWLLPLTGVLTVLLYIVMLFGNSIWKKVKDWNYLPKVFSDWIDRWVQASQWLRRPQRIIPMFLLTIVIWGVMWLTNLLLFKSLGLALGGVAGGLVLVLVYIGLFPALMPGNIGPFYFFASLAITPFGIVRAQAIVFAVILHAIVTIPPLVSGGIGLLLHTPRPQKI